MNNEPKSIKKRSTTLAWLLLIVLISAAIGLTYLKFFWGKVPTTEDVSQKEITSPVIAEALTTIIEEFNNNDTIKQYQKENIKINATLEGTTIKVTYEDTEPKTYDFKLESPNLIISINSNDADFKKVFPIIVSATQKRLNNEANIEEYINNFLNNDEEVTGLSKTTIEANKIEYSIDISKKIGEGEIAENQNTNTATESNNSNEENATNEQTLTPTPTPEAGE